MPGGDVAVRVHVDARCDPYEDILLASLLAAQRGQPLGVIAAIEDDQPRVGGEGRAQVLLGLRVAVDDHPRAGESGASGSGDLPGGGAVRAESSLVDEPEHTERR